MEGLLLKKQAHKRFIAFFVMAIMFISTLNIPAKASAEDALNIHADAAIIVEASTGKILYAKNEDTALGIASMSKMMTEYLMFEAIKDKKSNGIRNRRSVIMFMKFP